jgi:hypothetical protein
MTMVVLKSEVRFDDLVLREVSVCLFSIFDIVLPVKDKARLGFPAMNQVQQGILKATCIDDPSPYRKALNEKVAVRERSFAIWVFGV